MKKQMKTSLFTIVVGLSLLGAMLISATGNPSAPTANQQRALKGHKNTSPVTPSIAPESSSLPFVSYLTLVTCFTNGGSINMNMFEPEGHAAIWGKWPKWEAEQ